MPGPVDRSGASRHDELRALVFADGPTEDLMGALERVCRVLVSQLDVRGAVVRLMTRTEPGAVAAVDERSASHAELQQVTGEGPCQDAFELRRPVLVADLANAMGRWPGYASTALESGVRAVFAFPLNVGGAALGVLEAHHDEPGTLGHRRLTDALILAQLAVEIVLRVGVVTPSGELQPGLEAATGQRARIYQAQGMLMVAHDLTLTDALQVMQSYAFSHDLTLAEVADRVHAGHRLDDGP